MNFFISSLLSFLPSCFFSEDPLLFFSIFFSSHLSDRCPILSSLQIFYRYLPSFLILPYPMMSCSILFTSHFKFFKYILCFPILLAPILYSARPSMMITSARSSFSARSSPGSLSTSFPTPAPAPIISTLDMRSFNSRDQPCFHGNCVVSSIIPFF